jgi:dUTP pyrophosphatase
MNENIQIITEPGAVQPEYTLDTDAGMDIRAFIDEEITLKPGERRLIPTGNRINLPNGIEAGVRSRSGMALKYGVIVLNSPGTIDPGYQGDIGVILLNTDRTRSFTIYNGDRIAQIVFSKFERVDLEQADNFEASERGSKGFGSSGRT